MEGTVLKIHIVPPEGSDAFKELKGERILVGKRIHGVAIYPKGTRDGGVSVGIFVELNDGSFVHAETTAGLFEMAARAVRGAVEHYVGDASKN